ncbi:hypothetical protein [Bradyrhizobium erythrophlei]|uniref:hypothetical protein n=1 Tax=Bradyrhizobium erythrophlei TaxID=1437360 RepID=UPI001FCDDAE0|nr:hypothetical protein [Bradyrhizobium erythrophlei]
MDQGTTIVVCLRMASHCLGKRVHRADVAIQGSWVECNGDRGFFKRGHFGFDAQPLFL